MSLELKAVDEAFEKARGPYRKRQDILKQLRESDLGKETRSKLVEEASELEKEWTDALFELLDAMKASPVFADRFK